MCSLTMSAADAKESKDLEKGQLPGAGDWGWGAGDYLPALSPGEGISIWGGVS